MFRHGFIYIFFPIICMRWKWATGYTYTVSDTLLPSILGMPLEPQWRGSTMSKLSTAPVKYMVMVELIQWTANSKISLYVGIDSVTFLILQHLLRGYDHVCTTAGEGMVLAYQCFHTVTIYCRHTVRMRWRIWHYCTCIWHLNDVAVWVMRVRYGNHAYLV